MNGVYHYIFIDIMTFFLIIGLVGLMYWDYLNRWKRRWLKKSKNLNRSTLKYGKVSFIILKIIGIFFLFLFFLFIKDRFVDYVNLLRGRNSVNIMECVPKDLDNYSFICNNIKLQSMYVSSNDKANITIAYKHEMRIRVQYFQNSKDVLSVVLLQEDFSQDKFLKRTNDLKDAFSAPEDYRVILKKLKYNFRLYVVFQLIFIIFIACPILGYIVKVQNKKGCTSYFGKRALFIFSLLLLILLGKIFYQYTIGGYSILKRIEKEGNNAIINNHCTLSFLDETYTFRGKATGEWRFYCTEFPNISFYNVFLGFPTTAYYYNDIKDCIGQTVYFTQIKGTHIIYSVRGSCVKKR